MAANDTTVQQDRQQWAQWARHLLARANWVLLDTETTGLDRTAEIIELAVLDHTGRVLCDTVLRPELPIPLAASAIHGLTDADVEDAPTIVEIWTTLLPLLTGKRLVAYHVAFGLRMLRQTAGRYGLPFPIRPLTACVMEAYAAFAGRRSTTGHPLRQTLAAASEQLGVVAGTHRAADDCRATLAVLRAMADWSADDNDVHNDVHNLHRVLFALPAGPSAQEVGASPALVSRSNAPEQTASPVRAIDAGSLDAGARRLYMPMAPRVSPTAATVVLPVRSVVAKVPVAQRTGLRAVEQAWSEVRRVCKQHSPRVAALLASAHPVAIEAGIPPTLPTLVLQADYPFHFQRLCEPVHHRMVVAAVHAVLKQPLRVRVTLAPERRVSAASTASGAQVASHQGA